MMEYIIAIIIIFFGIVIASKMERIEQLMISIYELEAKRKEEK